jgi:hypothetical protein
VTQVSFPRPNLKVISKTYIDGVMDANKRRKGVLLLHNVLPLPDSTLRYLELGLKAEVIGVLFAIIAMGILHGQRAFKQLGVD